jgi:hypothetical protein
MKNSDSFIAITAALTAALTVTLENTGCEMELKVNRLPGRTPIPFQHLP